MLLPGAGIVDFALILDCASNDPASFVGVPEGTIVLFSFCSGTTVVEIGVVEMIVDGFSGDGEVVPLKNSRLLMATRITVVVVHHTNGDRPVGRLAGIASSRIGFILAQPCSGVIL